MKKKLKKEEKKKSKKQRKAQRTESSAAETPGMGSLVLAKLSAGADKCGRERIVEYTAENIVAGDRTCDHV